MGSAVDSFPNDVRDAFDRLFIGIREPQWWLRRSCRKRIRSNLTLVLDYVNGQHLSGRPVPVGAEFLSFCLVLSQLLSFFPVEAMPGADDVS